MFRYTEVLSRLMGGLLRPKLERRVSCTIWGGGPFIISELGLLLLDLEIVRISQGCMREHGGSGMSHLHLSPLACSGAALGLCRGREPRATGPKLWAWGHVLLSE